MCALIYSSICSVGVFIDICCDDLPIQRDAEHIAMDSTGSVMSYIYMCMCIYLCLCVRKCVCARLYTVVYVLLVYS